MIRASDSEFIALFILLGVSGHNYLEIEYRNVLFTFKRSHTNFWFVKLWESDRSFLRRCVNELRSAGAIAEAKTAGHATISRQHTKDDDNQLSF